RPLPPRRQRDGGCQCLALARAKAEGRPMEPRAKRRGERCRREAGSQDAAPASAPTGASPCSRRSAAVGTRPQVPARGARADGRGQRAVLALALGYFGAARALAPAEEEPALHAFLAPDRRKLAEAARRKDANAGDRHLFFRWLMQDADEKALLRFIGAARDNEHVSIPAVGQFLIDTDLQVVAAASDALPALALAELENVRPTAPTDVEPL